MADLTVAAIPRVLGEDEVPFVLGFVPDSRRYLEYGGAQFRRGIDRCSIDWRLDYIGLRAVVIESAGNSYLMASAGPLLNDWWPILEREGGNRTRPLLSAAVARRSVTFRSGSLSVDVGISPPGPGVNTVNAVAGWEGGLTDNCLLFAHATSLGVIKAALLLLGEHSTLFNPVPDVHIEVDGATVPLATLLQVADEAVNAIAWKQ